VCGDCLKQVGIVQKRAKEDDFSLREHKYQDRCVSPIDIRELKSASTLWSLSLAASAVFLVFC
jgi:hypothetical protein